MRVHEGGRPKPLRWRVVLLIGVSWAAFCVATLGVDRFPTWDEAVYWTKALGGPPTIVWLDHRSLGVPLLLSPVTLVSDSFVAGRLVVVGFLALVIAAGLRSWSFTLPNSSLLGSAFFLLGWPALFHATEFFPNLPVAVLVWTALGSTWAYVVVGRRDVLVVAVLAQAAGVIVRPADAVWTGLGVVVVLLIDATIRPHWRSIVGILGASSAVGLIPWLIESFILFGGPIRRAQGSKALFDNFTMDDPINDFHYGLAGGPTLPDPSALDLWVAAIWALGLVILGLFGALRSADDEAGARLAYGAGIVAGAAYFVFPLIPDPRMLLPSMAMLALPAGVIIGRLATSKAGIVPLIVVAVGFTIWSVGQGRVVVAQEVEASGDLLALADAIVADAGGRPCAVEARYGFPQVELRTGCQGSRTTNLDGSLRLRDEEPDVRYIVWLGSVEAPPGWESVDYGPTLREWSILRSNGGITAGP